jgi:hypothetical protein
MDVVPAIAESANQKNPRWNRLDAAQGVIDFEAAKKKAISQREFARESGIPRTTMQGWVGRKEQLDAPADHVAFFEGPAGQKVLHGLLIAAHLTFGKCGPDGIRRISLFFERAGLSPFVGLSYGAQQAFAHAMDNNILLYGDEQRQQLASMPPKNITLAEDETFFPETCLVAMDPVSGFIFLEKFADNRDSGTWTESLQASIKGLPVTVIQTVSDEAKGLVKHAKELGAQHTPDLFHPLNDIYKAIGPTLNAKLRAAEKVYEASQLETLVQIDERYKYGASINERGPGRPPNFDDRIRTASEAETTSMDSLKALADVKEQLKATVNSISDIYHPVDLTTGKPRTTAEAEQSFEQSFDVLADIADDLDVGERGQELLAKARRMIPAMIQAIGFFSESITAMLSAAKLAPDLIPFLLNCLIPLAYLQMAAAKAKGKRRETIRTTIESLSNIAHAPASPLTTAPESIRLYLLQLAQQCAEIFQRSSSCVEGRNGLLSLYHHAGRDLSPMRLRILQILHNYDIKRQDGTTAMERLSGTKPPDLFTWLLLRQPLPPRPAASRPKLALAAG